MILHTNQLPNDNETILDLCKCFDLDPTIYETKLDSRLIVGSWLFDIVLIYEADQKDKIQNIVIQKQNELNHLGLTIQRILCKECPELVPLLISPTRKVKVILLTPEVFNLFLRHDLLLLSYEFRNWVTITTKGHRLLIETKLEDLQFSEPKLRHELLHCYLKSLGIMNLPFWFEEGVCEFFSLQNVPTPKYCISYDITRLISILNIAPISLLSNPCQVKDLYGGYASFISFLMKETDWLNLFYAFSIVSKQAPSYQEIEEILNKDFSINLPNLYEQWIHSTGMNPIIITQLQFINSSKSRTVSISTNHKNTVLLYQPRKLSVLADKKTISYIASNAPEEGPRYSLDLDNRYNSRVLSDLITRGYVGIPISQPEYSSPGSSNSNNKFLFVKNLHSLRLLVTNKCNMACSYCYEKEEHTTTTPQHMPETTICKSIKDFFSIVARNVSRPASIAIRLFGGEPLIRPDLCLLAIRQAKKEASKYQISENELIFNLTTNGLLDFEEIIEECLPYSISIGISLDGPNEDMNRFRKLKSGRPAMAIVDYNLDNYIKYLEKLDVKTREKITTFICSTITTANYSSLQNLYEYAIQKSTNILSSNLKQNIGISLQFANKISSSKDFLPSSLYYEVAKNVAKFYTMCSKNGIPLGGVTFFPFLNMLKSLYKLRKPSYCAFTSGSEISIAPTGDVIPCGSNFCSFGNIMDSSLEKILLESRLYESLLTRDLPNDCKKCKIQIFCNGGCIANSFLYSKSINEKDPQCDLIKSTFSMLAQEYIQKEGE
jgi:uncharacterized protein